MICAFQTGYPLSTRSWSFTPALKHTRLCASKGPEVLRVKGSLRNEIISQTSFIESVGGIAAGDRKHSRARGRSTTDDHRPERYQRVEIEEKEEGYSGRYV